MTQSESGSSPHLVSDSEYLKKVLLSPVYGAAKRTELQFLDKFSTTMGNHVWLKREDQQPVKSFKLRGAYNCIDQLGEDALKKGVIAASAGNHAQGVAYSAFRKEIHATIVMPKTTPDIKVDAVKTFGGNYVNVIRHGSSFDEASDEARRLAAEYGYTMVPPFDHPDVIAGQGTIAREILDEKPDLDMLFVAVGGGGLMAGIAVYLKQLKPDLKIIAVEAKESACLQAALTAGKPVTLPNVGIFADGVAVKTMGAETFRLCQQYVDEVITVSNDEICAAIKEIFDDTRVIAEPAGALSIAGIRKYVLEKNINDKKIGGILCGANINFHTLRYVSERCELGEQKEAIFAIEIPERKGAFKQFCEILGEQAITEFNYRFAKKDQAHIFVGIKLNRGKEEREEVKSRLLEEGYGVRDLSDNEIAKLHVRYMIGGRPPELPNEKIYSFAFPERPKALLNFLSTLGEQWNITMFHYRNHGAAEGLVLAGFDVPDEAHNVFKEHLKMLNYSHLEQTENLAYKAFLSDLNGAF